VTQYSLFGAEAVEPRLTDLDGPVLAGAQWVRSAHGARLSVVVADRWRADALAVAFAGLDLASDDEPVVAAETGSAVRTAFTPSLVEHAARWTRGARTGLPADFRLDAGGLRLWAITAGRHDDAGFLLGTAPVSSGQVDDGAVHRAAGAQLSRLGVAASSLTRAGHAAGARGVGWRITSTRRLRRLAELLGPPPPGAGNDWPRADRAAG
jgi:hypothetical protein